MVTPVTDKNSMSQFWDKWYHADELERLKLVQQLTGMRNYTTSSLTNSYLVDLAEYLEKTLKAVKGGDSSG